MEDDDDFGDFGGFETADPTEAPDAAAIPEGITATPSPWAVYTAAAVQGVADPAALTGSREGEERTQAPHAAPDGSGSVTPNFVPPKPDPTPTNPAATVNTGEETGDGPSLGSPVSEIPWPTVTADNSPVPQPMRPDTEEPDTGSIPAADSCVTPPTVVAGETTDTETTYASLRAVQEHRDRLLKDLECMTVDQERWNRELVECKTQLEKQEARYDKIQVAHAEAVADMRKAGHDALSVIVAEYQELSQMTMSQQKEASQRELHAGLEEHNTRWQHHVEQQEELTKAVLEEMKSKMADQLKEALSTQREQLQTELRSALDEEREKHSADLTHALEAQREASTTALQMALQAEREKLQAVAREEKVKLEALIEEERTKSASAIRTALEEERNRYQERVDAVLGEERRTAAQNARSRADEARREMQAYVHQQQQADGAVRRRALATMDLFLEGTRKQLDTLLEQPVPEEPELRETAPPPVTDMLNL